MEKKRRRPYVPPKVLSVSVAPDITKCMQNTGGIEPRSTFVVYQQVLRERVANKTAEPSSEDERPDREIR